MDISSSFSTGEVQFVLTGEVWTVLELVLVNRAGSRKSFHKPNRQKHTEFDRHWCKIPNQFSSDLRSLHDLIDGRYPFFISMISPKYIYIFYVQNIIEECFDSLTRGSADTFHCLLRRYIKKNILITPVKRRSIAAEHKVLWHF